MRYSETILLKDGRECILRNGTPADAQAVLEVFQLTHGETDFLLSYPDENAFDLTGEEAFLRKLVESENVLELLAIVDGQVVGTAGIDAVGAFYKLRHRAEFGVNILKEYWGLGVGRALMEACIQCAREAGYAQLELSVVTENTRAIALYQKAGFVEFGRNPKGFRSRTAGFQEIVFMGLEL